MKNIERDIPGFEGRYVVSNHGYIRRKDRKKRNFGTRNNRGYMICHIVDNSGKDRMFQVSRLVAEAFLPNPEKKPEVDHINTDRHNNRADNLRWVTRRENQYNQTTVVNHLQQKLFKRQSSRKSCMVIYPDGSEHYFTCFKDAAKAIGCAPISISRCYHREQKNIFGGYTVIPWKESLFPDDDE